MLFNLAQFLDTIEEALQKSPSLKRVRVESLLASSAVLCDLDVCDAAYTLQDRGYIRDAELVFKLTVEELHNKLKRLQELLEGAHPVIA